MTRREWLATTPTMAIAACLPVRRPAEAFRIGRFRKIYEPGPRDAKGKPPRGWHLNDHCFVRGHDGLWHMFGIAWTDPGVEPAPTAAFLEHATSPSLVGPEANWVRREAVLPLAGDRFETVMWAPHVVSFEGQYHMFVATGGPDQTRWGITRATSPDLMSWTRSGDGPSFRDGFQARDPMVVRAPGSNSWSLYYTATEHPEGGRHVVACRTSTDLARWGDRRVVFSDEHRGTAFGPTESPFVVGREGRWYLLIGPRPYGGPPPAGASQHTQPGYVGTDVFASRDGPTWTGEDLVGHIPAHAAELVQDLDGRWYVSHCGVGQGGLHLASFEWGS